MDRKTWRVALVVGVVVAMARVVLAQPTLYVAPCGNDTYLGTNPVCQAGDTFGPLRTIQRALDRIATFGVGGTVVVTPGIWNERINVGGGDITIRSATAGSVVFLQPGGAGTVITRSAGAGQTLKLKDVWVIGGNANGAGDLANGGGIRVLGGNLDMSSCAVGDCDAVGDGGGIWFSGGVLNMTGCILTGNNAGSSTDHYGGALLTSGYDHVTLEQCTFLQNSAWRGAHAALLESGSTTPNTISNCEFRGASSSSYSALALHDSFSNLVGCTFVENNNIGYCIVLQDANVHITGGAMRFNHGTGCITISVAALMCEGVSLVGNEGTAIFGLLGASVKLDRCSFVAAGKTDVFLSFAGSGLASNCLFSGGSYAIGGEYLTIDRCTFVAQALAPLAYVDYCSVANSIVWGQAAGPLNCTGLAIRSSIVDHIDQWPAVDRVWMIDPRLDAEARPRAGSWAIDAADPALMLEDFADADGDGITNEPAPFDLDGNPRVHDDVGLPDQVGSASDLGAFEFQGTSCRADFDGDGFVTGQDYDLYVQAFEAGNTYADFDRDGFNTGLDFDGFVVAFEGGC